MVIENGINARELVESVYSKFTKNSVEEFTFPEDEHPARRHWGDSPGTYGGRSGHMYYETAHVLEFNDKQWLVGLGDAGVNARYQTRDILVLDEFEPTQEGVAESIRRDTDLFHSILFSNSDNTIGIHDGARDVFDRTPTYRNLTSMLFASRRYVLRGDDHLKRAKGGMIQKGSYVPAWVAPNPWERAKEVARDTEIGKKIYDIVYSKKIYSEITADQVTHDLNAVLNFYSDGVYSEPEGIGSPNSLMKDLEALRSHYGVEVVDQIAHFRKKLKKKLEPTLFHFMAEMAQARKPELYDQIREIVFS